jgi:hypothetical protein
MIAVAAEAASADETADKMAAANGIAMVDITVAADKMTAMSVLPQLWKHID